MIIIQNYQQSSQPLPRNRVVCRGKTYKVNINDLILDGQLDTSMAKWCEHRRDDGATLFLWSSRGNHHAREEARRVGIESLFSW